MGYELHLTRGDGIGPPADPIPVEDWLALARAQDDIVADGHAVTPAVPGFRLGDRDRGPSLSWSEGEVLVKGRWEGHVPRLVALAEALGAHVVGDDGERHRADGTSYQPDDDEDGSGPPADGAGPWIVERYTPGTLRPRPSSPPRAPGPPPPEPGTYRPRPLTANQERRLAALPLEPGQRVVQVGSHGDAQMALAASDRVGPGGFVLVIEPRRDVATRVRGWCADAIAGGWMGVDGRRLRDLPTLDDGEAPYDLGYMGDGSPRDGGGHTRKQLAGVLAPDALLFSTDVPPRAWSPDGRLIRFDR